jgi:putative endonuclease
MTFWVYILRCSDNSYYTGHTDHLEKRIGEHGEGLCGGYTASRLPVELVFSQEFTTRIEALAAEQQIKGWGRKKKEAMMQGDWAEVSRLAKSFNKVGNRFTLRQAQGERIYIYHDELTKIQPIITPE